MFLFFQIDEIIFHHLYDFCSTRLNVACMHFQGCDKELRPNIWKRTVDSFFVNKIYRNVTVIIIFIDCFRYHYFLQLKQDVIEGRILCTSQQAVELASYSMQAEFGNFDAERHTAHYLKDFQLFPKVIKFFLSITRYFFYFFFLRPSLILPF